MLQDFQYKIAFQKKIKNSRVWTEISVRGMLKNTIGKFT